ncbi:thrombospondin type-1 domain-containing protein 7A-like [Schistocerca piceifrons]|uniref:thrombospondin type-1 domain-containing protein 7A-like n=1 Tax=Schistocerca piceifrons TaxID=274613 RepID=UPI001F5F11D9|nr:thrombospondin type-1 domain-containing protein 7A-like [Schistocerca piceifrons]
MSGLCILLLIVVILVEGSVARNRLNSRFGKREEFIWKAGGWGPCFPNTGSCGDGLQWRTVWCAHIDGRAVLEYQCDRSMQPATAAACILECGHQKEEFQWDVAGWGPCEIVLPPKPRSNAINETRPRIRENLGVMQRNVSCILISHETRTQRIVDDSSCVPHRSKPESVRMCSVPRPQDCVVGPFSEWSTCEDPINCVVGGTNQTRVRIVLVAPMYGGRACPHLVESRPCESVCLQEPVREDGRGEYRIKMGDWRRCQAPRSIVPAGMRNSRHRGRNSDRHQVGHYRVSGYWSMQPVNHNRGSPTFDILKEEDLDFYYTYEAEVGYQTRDVSCRDSKGAVVDLSLCLEGRSRRKVPRTVQPCVVAEDCVVNQWSSWTKLQDGCVDGGGRVTTPEIQVRRREVVRLGHGLGRPCPRLIERRINADPEHLPVCAETYRWLASHWSACMVVDDEERKMEVECGGGVQLRDVACVTIAGSKPVRSELCSSFVPLPTVQRCEVACPRDCEVAAWAAWGPCRPTECNPDNLWFPQGYRERRRSVRVTSSETGLQCPSVREVQPCMDAVCHEWVVGQWSPCQLIAGVRHCGEGRRARLVTCRTMSGMIVEEALCARSVKKPPTEEACLLPCPFDCVLSPWSSWSPCSHSCTSPEKLALRQRNRTVIAPPGVGGHPCPNPDEMLQIEPCNTHSCHGFSWRTLPWQPCTPVNSTALSTGRLAYTRANGTDGDCGLGVQTRDVWCVEANERRDDHHCFPLIKPDSTRPCRLGCHVNCSVSPWSDWNPCNTDCEPAPPDSAQQELAPAQLRRRLVIQPPENGGKQCGKLMDWRPCPLSGARCRRFNWDVGNWSDCQLPNNVECGVGYRVRAVWCNPKHRMNKVEPSNCIEQHPKIPATSEPCYADCTYNCVVSEWSEWSPCTHSCLKSKRTRELIGHSKNRDICTNSELFPLVETRTCPCRKQELRVLGNWSECIIDTEITSVRANGRRVSGVCGSGTKYRRVGCFNTTGHLIEPICMFLLLDSPSHYPDQELLSAGLLEEQEARQRCIVRRSLCGASSGLEEEPCLIPCPVDCALTEWSAWEECTTLCGPGLHNRTRKLLREPQFGGRPCGEIVQTKVCNSPCNVFRWVAGGWSECQLIGADQERGCGTGDQYRQVRCMKVTVNEVAVEVPDIYCDPVKQPADVNACHVACPGDCVVSPWSDWSECAKPCDVNKQRQRTRSVLRKPAKADYPCPPLIEVQSCEINVTCFTYSWQETRFSSCLPLGGSPCGEGIQARAVYCRRSDGRTVEDRWCDDQTKPSPVEKWCYVDCTVDCELTEWGSWDHAGCQCGSAGSAMNRYRFVMTNNSPSGRACPRDLVQRKPCPAIPCYTWYRGPWSECNLDGAWCGHGTITRNVTCLRDGEPVDDYLCGDAPDIHTTDKCYAPCKGDCQVSEWSHWSHCHRNCQSSSNDGYMTRSRAILRHPSPEGEACPTALWETRPCFSGACLTFDWVISRDGKITCQRSDGVVVTGGCENRPMPCSNPRCETVPHAYCDITLGICICGSGYYAHVGHDQQLTKCIQASENKGNAKNKVQFDGEFTGAPDEILSRYYYPRDDEINVWMFAVIGIGCLFVIFVAVSVYVMCYKNGGIPGLRLLQQTQQQDSLTVLPAAKA